jgi:tetratricopeptide (TPR) repeat protein
MGYRLPQAPEVPEEDEGPHALVRARPYVLAALCFALIAWLVLWLYGLHNRTMTLTEAAHKGSLALSAGQALVRGDVAEARRIFEQAQRQTPDALELFFVEGHLVAAEGGEAARRLEAQAADITQGRHSLRELLMVAGLRDERGDAGGALEAVRLAARRFSGNPDVHYLLASALLRLGEYPDVIAEAGEYERLSDDVPEACRLRGQAYLMLNQPEAALREFQSALGYPGATVQLRISHADALNSLGRHHEALEALRVARAQAPRNAEIYLSQGIIADAMGDVNLAEASYREAVRLEPTNVRALNNLAYLLAVNRGKPADALSLAKQAAELAPKEATVLDTLAHIHQLLGRDAEALPLLYKARALDPREPYVQLHLALAYQRAGRKAEAGKLLHDLIATTRDEKLRQGAQDLLKGL